MSTHTTNLSAFYSLFADYEVFELSFPSNADEEGPFWNDDGSLIVYPDGSIQSTMLRIVELGSGRYRLAENPIFEAPTTLFWGDEFVATRHENKVLEIKFIVVPQQFKHVSSFSSYGITSGSPMSNKIHELGGGWETVMGGILIISLPENSWAYFNKWRSTMQELKLI